MIDAVTSFQWLILSLTALCIGMSKTGVQGMMLLVVPHMAMAFGAKESTGVILPMLCIADIMAVAYYKRIADWKVVAKLLPSAILGFFVAIFVDKLIPAHEFRQLMGWTLALAFRCNAVERTFWQGEPLDEALVVFSTFRLTWRIYHHDRQCSRSRTLRLSSLHAQGENGLHRHQRLVLPGCQSTESPPSSFCMGQHHVGYLHAQSPHDPHHRHRCLVGHTHRQAISRTSFPSLHPDSHHPISYHDVGRIKRSLYGQRIKNLQKNDRINVVGMPSTQERHQKKSKKTMEM